MGIPCIDQLGAEIEERWRSLDCSPAAFPETVERLLQNANLPTELSAQDIVQWAFGTTSLPFQADPLSKFGQPPVTLFRAPRFYIDALFWIDGTTSIHQHAFSGAFQVLVGSSIETLFSFETDRTFDGHFLLGTLRPESCALLQQGAVRPIVNGPRLIHAIFHLARPSVSIVVRTVNDPGSAPQFRYSRSGIAHNPFLNEESIEKKLQLVSMLKATQHPSMEALIGDLIARSDIHSAYRIVRECVTLGFVEQLIDRVHEPGAKEPFRRAVKDGRREMFLISRRGVVSDPDLRFFLGVLLNAPRKRDVLALSNQRNPNVDPGRQVAAWLRSLSKVSVKLQAEGAAWQPNLIGLPDFDDGLEEACMNILNDQPLALDAKTAKAVGQLRALPALACLFES